MPVRVVEAEREEDARAAEHADAGEHLAHADEHAARRLRCARQLERRLGESWHWCRVHET